jgi:5'-nucleotidase
MSIAATSAAVGKDFSDFDLIVSGINNGTNLGPVAQFSGTIGATIAAITKIGANTPGIAVSMPEHPVNATVDDAAAFVVTLVGQLADNLGRWHDTLLPAGVALSINYPDLAFDDLTGVKLTVQGRLDLVGPGTNRVFRAQLIDPTHMLFVPTRVEKPTDDVEVPNADTTAFAQGFITITPVAADDTTRETARQQVQRLLRHIVRE